MMSRDHLSVDHPVIAKIRYLHPGAEAYLTMDGKGGALCRFKEAQRAVTPGQAAVFYEGDHILCGGTIV